jgi:hypothetical protein
MAITMAHLDFLEPAPSAAGIKTIVEASIPTLTIVAGTMEQANKLADFCLHEKPHNIVLLVRKEDVETFVLNDNESRRKRYKGACEI